MMYDSSPTSKSETVIVDDEAAREYKSRQERLLAQQEATLERRKLDAQKLAEFYRERYGDDPEYQARAYAPVSTTLHAIEVIKSRIEFARPRSAEDIAYRQKVMDELGRAIVAAVPSGYPLRFHGAPLYAIRDILASGGLSSSVDRLGAPTSYDVADQVSVTMPDTIDTTISGYTGLVGDEYLLPAGGIFVLLPRSQEEAEAGSSMLMNNVNFSEHPEQFVSLLTSPENLPRVREWATSAGVNPDAVCEFFDFPDQLRATGERIARGEVTLQELVPYALPPREDA